MTIEDFKKALPSTVAVLLVLLHCYGQVRLSVAQLRSPCNVAPKIDDGRITLNRDGSISVTCDDGFVQDGDVTLASCDTSTGRWSDLPTCALDLPSSCDSPPEVTHGMATLNAVGSLSVTCDSGYLPKLSSSGASCDPISMTWSGVTQCVPSSPGSGPNVPSNVLPQNVVCRVGTANQGEVYSSSSAQLQIFAWMRASCDGIVTSVTFSSSSSSSARSFYFAIFEPVLNNAGSFRLVNYISVPVDATRQGWQTVQLDQTTAFNGPLRVGRVNTYGIFYSSSTGLSVVAYRSTTSADPSATRYTTFTGARALGDLQNGQQLRNGSDLNGQAVSRIPALTAQISQENSCGPAPVFANARQRMSTMQGVNGTSGDSVTFDCIDGYNFKDSNRVSNCRLTGDSAQWSSISACVPTSTSRSVCSTTPVFPNAQTLTSSNANSATFQCSSGYVFGGAITKSNCVTDSSSSKWSPISPCIKSCGAAPFVANSANDASFSGSNSITGTTVRYWCLDGFSMTPANSDVITCLASGRWTDNVPQCRSLAPRVPPCNQIPVIMNGKVIDDGGFSPFSENTGTVIRYQCNLGCQFLDPSITQVTCTTNGWSTLPQCFVITDWVAQNFQCGSAPVVNNGYASSVIPSTRMLQYTCLSGYFFDASTPQGAVTCSSYGQWSMPRPKCTNSVCGLPPDVSNGFIESTTFDVGTASVGDMVFYRCMDGFQFPDYSGNSALCRASGNWDNVPTCILAEAPTTSTTTVTTTQRTTRTTTTRATATTTRAMPTTPWTTISPCENPPIISNGYVTNRLPLNGNYYQNRVRYECAPGFMMYGNATVACINNAWQALPNCVQQQQRVQQPMFLGPPPDVNQMAQRRYYGSGNALKPDVALCLVVGAIVCLFRQLLSVQ